MKRFRVGTEAVEGYQLTGGMAADDDNLRPFDIGFDLSGPELQANVPTRLGWMKAKPGDWIMRNDRGEFFVVAPADFDAMYEEV